MFLMVSPLVIGDVSRLHIQTASWTGREGVCVLDRLKGSSLRIGVGLDHAGLRVGNRQDDVDVSPDGKQILFDRFRENSDVVLIDLPPR
jgi:hypothetical protein